MVRTSDYDRYLTALSAPEPARARLLALYAFHAELAALPLSVSDPTIGFIRLAWWREVLAEMREGKPARPHEVAQAIARERLPLDTLEELITGYEADVGEPQAASFAELQDRIRNTTGRLHRAALRILDVADAETVRAADALSLAWGMLGVLRAERGGHDIIPPDVTGAEISAYINTLLAEIKAIRTVSQAKPLFLLVPLARYHLRRPQRGFGYYLALLRGVLFQ